MSGPVKRYQILVTYKGGYPLATAEPFAKGAFVGFDDYETAVRERDEARADAASWEQQASDRVDDVLEAIKQRDQLRALLEAAQRDAERYRWLRDVWWLGDDYFDTPDPMAHANSADEFDAAIDEARIPRASVVEHHAPHCDLNKPSSFVKCTCGYERIARAGG